MPHITTAMQRSVRRGVSDIFFDSLLGKRDIVGDVNSVKSTFSSWHNCMQKSYCKYPVIAIIVIGGLILFSILWCIIRCACCGMSCCCSCFSFLKCCDCCGGLCDGKKDKPHKYKDEPSPFPPSQGYQAPAPMMGGALNNNTPQYATFEVGKNGLAVDKPAAISEDALPPMPSWDNAVKKHVLTAEEKNGVELGELDHTTGQQVPLMTGGAISSPPSPVHDMGHNQYGAHPGQAGADGYMTVGGVSPYGQNQNGYNQGPYNQNAEGYRGPSRGPPGMGGRGQMSPGGAYGQSSYDVSGRGYADSEYSSGRGYAPSQTGSGRGYGPPSPQDPYGNNNNYSNGGYERQGAQGQGMRPQPTRQYSGHTMDSRPGMQRQYTDQSYHTGEYEQNQPRGPSQDARPISPLNNNSGFDFNGTGQDSYSRPAPQRQQTYNSNYQGSTAPPSYASRSPPPQESNYRGYGQGGRGPPQPLMPGGGRSREPQAWDPVQR